MSKYIKLDDAIGVATRGTNNYFICKALKDLPTIEVSEEQLSKLQTSENSVENTTVSEDFTSISRANSKLEVSEDAISREDAVNALIAHFIPQTYTGDDVDRASKLARKIMANVPSVTTEQSSIVGEWNWKSQDICDNCGYEIPHLQRIVGETVLMDSKDWDYCPNCGAKMKGAEE